MHIPRFLFRVKDREIESEARRMVAVFGIDDIEIRRADVRDPATLESALAGVDELVISLAFPGLPVEQPKKGYTFLEVDAGGAQALVSAGQRAGVGRVVYLSGAGAGHDDVESVSRRGAHQHEPGSWFTRSAPEASRPIDPGPQIAFSPCTR